MLTASSPALAQEVRSEFAEGCVLGWILVCLLAIALVWAFTCWHRRRAAARMAHESEQRLSTILEHLPVPIRISRPDGSIEHLNRAFIATFGYTLDEIPTVAAWHLAAYPDPAQREEVAQEWQRLHNAQTTQPGPTLTVAIQCKDGSTKHAELTAMPLAERDILILADRSEQVRAVADLAAAEERLATIIGNSEAIIYQVAPDGTFLLTDGRGLAALGRKAGDEVGRPVSQLFSRHPQARECLEQALTGNHTDCVVTVRERTYHNLNTPIFDQQGQVRSVIGIATDVTELMAMRQQLAHSEQQFRSLFNCLREGLALNEIRYEAGEAKDFVTLDANPAFERLLGLTPEGYRHQPGSEVYRNGLFAHFPLFASVARGGPPVQLVSLHGHGTFLSVSVVSPRPGQFALVLEDITTRMRIQQELAVRERKFRAIFENATVGMAISDGLGHLTRINQRLADILGYSQEELLGRSRHDLLESDGEMIPPLTVAGKVQGLPRRVRYRRKDGSTGWALEVSSSVDGPGHNADQATILVDVSPQVAMEQALRQSEQRLSLALEAVNDGLWDLNLLTNELYLSPRWYALLGFTPETLPPTPDNWLTRIHPDDIPQIHEALNAALHSGKNLELEYRMATGQGEQRWLHSRGKVVEWTAEGKPARLIGTIVDITERRRAADRYRMLFESAKDGILLIENGRIVECNPMILTIFGYTHAEIIGLHPAALSPTRQPSGRSSERAARSILERVSRGEKFIFEWQHRRADGTDFPAEVAISLVNLSGETHVLAYIRDISERRQMQALLIQSEKMLSLGGLAAGMAHEINNPLGIILQGAQNILRRLDPAPEANRSIALRLGLDLEVLQEYCQQRNILRYLQGIREAGERTAQMVQNMLNFSRRSDSSKVATDLNALLDRTLAIVASDYNIKKKYEFHRVTLVRDYDPQLPRVPCAANEIEQVILNVVRNAAQAMWSAKTFVPRLSLRTMSDHGWARIEVEDNGPGIPAQNLQRIFEPFYTTKGVGEGTGLGLSVSYSIIVTNHHGQIFATANKDGGTTIVIRLPFFSVEDHPPAPVSPS